MEQQSPIARPHDDAPAPSDEGRSRRAERKRTPTAGWPAATVALAATALGPALATALVAAAASAFTGGRGDFTGDPLVVAVIPAVLVALIAAAALVAAWLRSPDAAIAALWGGAAGALGGGIVALATWGVLRAAPTLTPTLRPLGAAMAWFAAAGVAGWVAAVVYTARRAPAIGPFGAYLPGWIALGALALLVAAPALVAVAWAAPTWWIGPWSTLVAVGAAYVLGHHSGTRP